MRSVKAIDIIDAVEVIDAVEAVEVVEAVEAEVYSWHFKNIEIQSTDLVCTPCMHGFTVEANVSLLAWINTINVKAIYIPESISGR